MGERCFCFGHRDTGDWAVPQFLEAACKLACDFGVNEFYIGGYGGFDRLGESALLEVKHRCPTVRLYRLLAYHPYNQEICLPKGFDGTYYPQGLEAVPQRLAILRANRAMVDASEHIIACVFHQTGNAHELLRYAQRRERQGKLRIICLKPVQ